MVARCVSEGMLGKAVHQGRRRNVLRLQAYLTCIVTIHETEHPLAYADQSSLSSLVD